MTDRNIAAEKGFTAAAQHNGVLSESQQRALGVMFAPGGSVVARGGHGTPMESGLCHGEVPSYDGGNRSIAGTSIFDPTLTDALYKWFNKKDGLILDPFAGGSTRGVVAAYGGYPYVGIELRPGQVEQNIANATEIQANLQGNPEHPPIVMPTWIVGDSTHLEKILTDQYDLFGEKAEFDFLIACPPYYDLEIYSFGADDGSAKQTYEEFIAWYEAVFKQAVARLKNNRFAAIVVGDIRDHEALGEYRYFVMHNMEIFKKLGLRLYNQAILETAVGSLPVRIGSQFPKYRKLGMTHQHILIFWKGDNDKQAIVDALGELSQEAFGRTEDDETL